MVKVCFIGVSLRLEHAAIERLRSEMDVLSEQEPEIEFWFHGFHSDFIKSMLEEVVSLKKRKANQHIEIVDVVDPIELDAFKKKAQEMELSEEEQYDRQLRADHYDQREPVRIEYAPWFDYRTDLHPDHYIAHSQRIDRWMVNGCDYLITYTYENLLDTENTTIKRARAKNPNMKVISISVPSTAERIEELKAQLDDRKKYVVDSLLAGESYSSLGRALGITSNRVHQIAGKATRLIYRQLKEELE